MLALMKTTCDVLILGAGASGLMCAAELSETSHLRIGVIEGNAQAGKKLGISGGGKCNVTNVRVTSENFLADSEFVTTVFQQFGNEDLLALLQAHAIALELRKSRYYFCRYGAKEIVSLLLQRAQGVKFFYETTIESVLVVSGGYLVMTNRGEFYARTLVIATGGESYRSIGASAIGLHLAQNLQLRTAPFIPALVGLTLQTEQFWMKSLSGISCNVAITVGSKILEEEMLFTHKGISGPAVLSASLYWNKGEIGIDFLPHKALHVFLNTNKLLSTALPLPKRFMKAFLEHIGVEDVPCYRLNEEMLARLQHLKSYRFAPAGNFGFSKAEVSRGGIEVSELHAKSLMSRRYQNLYCIGEVVDVTGELGGYNFQWAFSSAVVCARHICKKI